MNILYIADSSSIHDRKWMSWFADKDEYSAFLLTRKSHKHKDVPNITHCGLIEDYSVFKKFKNKSTSKLINDIISNEKIDLVHIFFAEPNALWIDAIPENIPVVLTTRGSDVLVGLKNFAEESGLKYKSLKKAYRKVLDRCSAITSTSQDQIDVIHKFYGQENKTQLVRTGMDISLIKPKVSEEYIFFPRAMRPLYNHELAIESVVKLPEEVKDNYTFVFTDQDSDLSEYVEKIDRLLQESGIKYEFHNSMEADQYFDVLSKSAVVVMTPKSDGAPVSGMEALASQSKLVLPNLNYDHDLYEGAFYYEASNSDACRDAILKALDTSSEFKSDYLDRVNRDFQMEKVRAIYEQFAG